MAARRLRKVGMVASAQGVPAARSIQRARLWARQSAMVGGMGRPAVGQELRYGAKLMALRLGWPAPRPRTATAVVATTANSPGARP
ncbi:MAG: hypothetical protein BRC31_04390 [Actinobacteria bacterium QS_5_72_10]|nr:MAG: hypothetical protein BRC31_04390 [Actinobacteria bacterium QS_5_72_10]